MTTTTLAGPFDLGGLARSEERPLEGAAELKIGLRSMPYLADHGFQDMVVLPGAFYIDLALSVDRDLAKRIPGFVRNATFDNPVILSADDTVIGVEVKDRGDGRVEYAFYEGSIQDRGAKPRQYAARLEIERSPATAGSNTFSIEAFQAQSSAVIGADQFYGKLRANGNQYGPGFQKLTSIWLSGNQALGRFSVTPEDGAHSPNAIHPRLLDAVAQLLGAFSADQGRTFVLRSIETIEIASLAFPATLWGHAVLLDRGDGRSLTGNVRVFDQSGKVYLELSGIAFTFLDRVDAPLDRADAPDRAAGEAAGASIVIASNFTAEPIEDVLKFWGDHFGVPTHLEFAPYNQILQQLLDKGSAFHRNRDGFNAILLGLEEWATGNPGDVPALSKARADECFGSRARHVLPNGLEIAHLNRYETEYLYREIFEDECYARQGIRLSDGDTVVDIGANIGLFSLYVMSRCKNARIYALEPAPVVHDLLKANCEAYGPGRGASVHPLNVGASDEVKTAALTFYEKSSVFSSFHADESEDREAIKAIVRNMLANATSVEDDAVEAYVDELTADRLTRRIQECRMTSVSDLIREHRIERINLLKIDAEKSELDIIKGIADADWAKIDQIVVEIHDRTYETVRQVQDLLAGKGYRCALEHEKLLERSGLFNLFATRLEADGASTAPAADGGTTRARRIAGSLKRNIDDLCAALASFMNQAKVPLVLSVCPASPAARADAVLDSALRDAEQELLSRAGVLANVHVIGSAAPLERFPLADYYDPHGRELGHIPYTPECYAAIGTALYRTISNLHRKPYKVIVLDCDNTLWKGVCGEDGSHGIELSSPYLWLQQFMVEQMNAGMLLCLCSKNSESDVLEVFEQRADMVLKREHVVAHRVNWNSKSDNIRSLAQELNLGLDSFIFIDDNPVECAEVQASCPGVLALQLPVDCEAIPAFLGHVWAFDRAGGKAATEEDRNRTRMYQEDAERRRFRERTYSLKDFIAELKLEIDIADATDDQIGRISQLTYRTNQFNFTTIRRSEDEIREFLERGHTCLTVRVADRFGDYGLVGVLLYETLADRCKVDTLLLSCRVLGRGVEHAILARLGERAVKAGKPYVELPVRPTEKNQPAMAFAQSIGEGYGSKARTSWFFTAECLASVAYDPDNASPDAPEEEAASTKAASASGGAARFDALSRREALQRAGTALNRIDLLMRAIEEHRLRKEAPQAAADSVPGNTVETHLLGIWRKVLGRPRIGLNDNFFEAGGTSLRAVQVIATIKKELNRNLSIVSLFESPTVSLLAARLNAPAVEAPGNPAAAAALRGQQRRTIQVRRHAS